MIMGEQPKGPAVSNMDLASILQLSAVLILLAPALVYMLRNKRQSLRHLGIWALIVAVVVAAVVIFA